MKYNRIYLILVILIGSVMWLATSCSDPPPDSEPLKPVLQIRFSHSINGSPVVFDQQDYVNDAGNPYLINEVQYFISELTLWYRNGTHVVYNNWDPFHYVDSDLDYTMSWIIPDTIQAGLVDSLSFRLGIKDELNESFMFVNPPERDMFWPEYLGGGYHYMKLNGKWVPADGSYPNLPFDFHVGKGQIYEAGVITSFVDNSMPISLAGNSFELNNGDTTCVGIEMQIENWFRNPNEYNHDVWGGYIMNNQEAMHLAVENSHDVFKMIIE